MKFMLFPINYPLKTFPFCSRYFNVNYQAKVSLLNLSFFCSVHYVSILY